MKFYCQLSICQNFCINDISEHKLHYYRTKQFCYFAISITNKNLVCGTSHDRQERNKQPWFDSTIHFQTNNDLQKIKFENSLDNFSLFL